MKLSYWRVVIRDNRVSFFWRKTPMGSYEISTRDLQSLGVDESSETGPHLWLKLTDGSLAIMLIGVAVSEIFIVERLLRMILANDGDTVHSQTTN